MPAKIRRYKNNAQICFRSLGERLEGLEIVVGKLAQPRQFITFSMKGVIMT